MDSIANLKKNLILLRQFLSKRNYVSIASLVMNRVPTCCCCLFWPLAHGMLYKVLSTFKSLLYMPGRNNRWPSEQNLHTWLEASELDFCKLQPLNSQFTNNNNFEQNDWNRKKQGKVSKVSSTFKVDSYWLMVIKCSFMRKDGHDWKAAWRNWRICDSWQRAAAGCSCIASNSQNQVILAVLN